MNTAYKYFQHFSQQNLQLWATISQTVKLYTVKIYTMISIQCCDVAASWVRIPTSLAKIVQQMQKVLKL